MPFEKSPRRPRGRALVVQLKRHVGLRVRTRANLLQYMGHMQMGFDDTAPYNDVGPYDDAALAEIDAIIAQHAAGDGANSAQPPAPLVDWETIARDRLSKHWGFSEFRPGQREAIEAAVHGRDSLVVLATGSGKSVCFQIVPLITGKPAVVISPLISLMIDQVAACATRGIRAVLLGMAQTDTDAEQRALRGDFDLVYMSPEKLQGSGQALLQGLANAECGLSLVAIDEAHCVVEWGFDFRPSYAQLGGLRPSGVAMMALTATAPPDVRVEVRRSHTYIHHTYMHTCVHTCMHTCVHTCTHTYLHTYIHYI